MYQSSYPYPRISENPEIRLFFKIIPFLTMLNILINVRQTLLYYLLFINFVLLKTVSLFTFHSLFHILSSLFSLYPEIRKNFEDRPTFCPNLPR